MNTNYILHCIIWHNTCGLYVQFGQLVSNHSSSTAATWKRRVSRFLEGQLACLPVTACKFHGAMNCLQSPSLAMVTCTTYCNVTISVRTTLSVQCLLLELFEMHIDAEYGKI
jgi:hypothetical protein